MKIHSLRLWLLPVLLSAAAGCTSPGSRIAQNQAAFDAWPADVQARVRAGKISMGFTPEQVRVALGEPARKFTRTSAAGPGEVWVYRELGPDTGTGLTVGLETGGGTGVGGGPAFENYRYSEYARVSFENGLVNAIDVKK